MATGRIGVTPNLRTRWSKAPAGGTTSLSGLDDNSVSLVYDAGFEAVYRNGVLLSRGNDYTATNGTTITLIDATIAGDIIEVFANQAIPLTSTYTQAVADAKFINNSLVDAKGDIIAATAADTVTRLAAGTNNQVLMADSAQATGLKYANEATATLTAKGDILSATAANTLSRLAVGSNDQVLTADSSTATGLKWATPSAGGMTLLASGSLAASTTGVDLQSISSAYQALMLRISGWSTTSTGAQSIRLNNDSGTNYDRNRIGTDTTAITNNTGQTEFAFNPTITAASTNGGAVIWLYNYASTTTFKFIESISTYIAGLYWKSMGGYNSTSAINRITLISTTAFDAGTYELFGVK